jgi:hypothetical protein
MQELHKPDSYSPAYVFPVLAGRALGALGSSQQYDSAIPIATMRVSMKEKIKSPGATSRMDS